MWVCGTQPLPLLGCCRRLGPGWLSASWGARGNVLAGLRPCEEAALFSALAQPLGPAQGAREHWAAPLPKVPSGQEGPCLAPALKPATKVIYCSSTPHQEHYPLIAAFIQTYSVYLTIMTVLDM